MTLGPTKESDESKVATRNRSSKRWWLLVILGVAALAAVIYWWPLWFFINGARYIGNLPDKAPYNSTRFEFRFGHATRYVHDPDNHLQWVFGELPDAVTVRNGKRLVVYNAPKAVIKSWRDSIDVQDDSLKHKGWMGIWSKNRSFLVDSEGVIHEDEGPVMETP